MKTLVRAGLALALALLAACDRKPAVDRSPNRFPGFTQASGQGETPEYYFEPAAIHRNARGWVDFKLARLVPGGYVMQDATTDCRANFRGLDGVKFRDDGTREDAVPGEIVPVDFRDLPPLAATVAAVCAKSEENRTLYGAFDPAKALQMLHGPYRPELNGVRLDKIEAAADSPGELGFAGKSGVVRVLLSEEFTERGQTKYILLTGTQLDGEGADCEDCGQLIGAAVFVKDGDKWRLEAEYPDLEVLGSRGQAPRLSWRRIGHDRYAAVAESAELRQGLGSASIGVYELADHGWNPLLQFTEEGTRPGQPVEAAISFGEPTAAYADATIVVKGDKGKDRKLAYLFENGAYTPPRPPAPTAAFVGPPLPPGGRDAVDIGAVLEGYAAAVNRHDPAKALGFWQQPPAGLRKSIAAIKSMDLDVKRVDVNGDKATAWVEMNGKSKSGADDTWRGGMELALTPDGLWRIASMNTIHCPADCVFPPPKKTVAGADTAAAVKAAVRAHLGAGGRHDGAKKPAGAAVEGKEVAKINYMAEPTVRKGKARVWVDLTLRDRSGPGETWRGTVNLRQAGSAWIVGDLERHEATAEAKPKPKPKPKPVAKPKPVPTEKTLVDGEPKPKTRPARTLDGETRPEPETYPRPVSGEPKPRPAAPAKPATAATVRPPAGTAKPATSAGKPPAAPPAKPGAATDAKPKPGTETKPKPKPKRIEPESDGEDFQPYRRPPAEDEGDPNIP